MILDNQSKNPQRIAELNVRLVKADGSICDIKDSLIRETMLDVYINEILSLRLVCTPENLSELVVGRLITEGIIEGSSEIERLYICENAYRAKVYLKHDIKLENNNKIYTEPTCCTDNRVLADISGKEKLRKLEKPHYLSEWVFELADKFKEDSSLHEKTNGTHSCYLSYKGEFLQVFEDIGRHNALDKAVGYADINGFERAGCILFTTGRVPVDMVRKAVMAKIPVLVSKSVPTAEAVEMANKYNLALICRAWPDSYVIYN